MKKMIYYFIFLCLIVLAIIYREDITNYVTNNIIKQEKEQKLKLNEYAKKKDYEYVKITNDFTINNRNEIRDIFYTIVDSGMDNFSFYCDSDYKSCNDDVKEFFNDKDTLSHINNFVHPYNSFKNIKISVSNYGKITLDVSHIYTIDDVKIINEKIDEFISTNIKEDMSDADKIKLFHDYIVNNTKFDTAIETSEDRLNSSSYNAYGLLINHLAICGGYTDTMAIYLDKLNIPNYRISTEEHVWNLVYFDNKWSHLDVTWDDPVTSNGVDMLMYDYYFIDTNTLITKDTTQHNFDRNIYREAQ